MKAGLKIGQTAEADIVVSREMFATFGGQTVHELYSTASLVQHMEWVARKIIVPYLEPHEEGMGFHVEVSHLALTLPGMNVRLKATVSDIRENKIVCDVEAFNLRGKLARGTVTQAIIQKEWLERKTRELQIINQLAEQSQSVSHHK